jgi:hypothetical protein
VEIITNWKFYLLTFWVSFIIIIVIMHQKMLTYHWLTYHFIAWDSGVDSFCLFITFFLFFIHNIHVCAIPYSFVLLLYRFGKQKRTIKKIDRLEPRLIISLNCTILFCPYPPVIINVWAVKLLFTFIRVIKYISRYTRALYLLSFYRPDYNWMVHLNIKRLLHPGI